MVLWDFTKVDKLDSIVLTDVDLPNINVNEYDSCYLRDVFWKKADRDPLQRINTWNVLKSLKKFLPLKMSSNAVVGDP